MGPGDDDARVMGSAAHFLGLMSELTSPDDFCYHAFASDRDDVRTLTARAARVATGTGDACASLTIRSGEVPSFRMTGPHAVATVHREQGDAVSVRLGVVLLVLLIVIAALCMLR